MSRKINQKGKQRKYFFVFFISFIVLFFIGVKSVVNNHFQRVNYQYNKLIGELNKEKDEYWGVKSELDKLIDTKIMDEDIRNKFKKVQQQDITRVVFEK